MIRSGSPAPGPSSSQNQPKSSPLPGNLTLPCRAGGLLREARNGLGGDAPGHDADVGSHPKPQLDSRITLKDRPEVPPLRGNLLLVFQGISVGPYPVNAAATYLENYAKKLSP
jgi:hypothetical protein